VGSIKRSTQRDEGQDLARTDLELDAVHRLHDGAAAEEAAVGREVLHEAVDFEDRFVIPPARAGIGDRGEGAHDAVSFCLATGPVASLEASESQHATAWSGDSRASTGIVTHSGIR
jgi:hypothetical protein